MPISACSGRNIELTTKGNEGEVFLMEKKTQVQTGLLALILITLLMSSGCSTVKRDLPVFNQQFQSGCYTGAGELASGNAGKNEDKISDTLWGLQAGAAARASGALETSNEFFDLCEKRIKKDQEKLALLKTGAQAGAVLVNDTILNYKSEE